MNKSLKDILWEKKWEKNITNDWHGRVHYYHGRVNVKDWEIEFEIGRELLGGDIEIVVRGHLKYDGCMNLWFLESKEDNCMSHFCSPECVNEFADAIKWVWTKAPLMRMWEG